MMIKAHSFVRLLVPATAILSVTIGTALAAEVTPPVSGAVSSSEPESSISQNRLAQLEWSKNPGVYEGDLRRRFGNPLYFGG